MIEWHSGAFTTGQDVLEGLEQAAENMDRLYPDRKSWGTSDSARRGYAAAEALVGGPATGAPRRRPTAPAPAEAPST